jgi:hypothetical protein
MLNIIRYEVTFAYKVVKCFILNLGSNHPGKCVGVVWFLSGNHFQNQLFQKVYI